MLELWASVPPLSGSAVLSKGVLLFLSVLFPCFPHFPYYPYVVSLPFLVKAFLFEK